MDINQIEAFQYAIAERITKRYRGLEWTEEVENDMSDRVLQAMMDNDYPRGREYMFVIQMEPEEESDDEENITIGFYLPNEEEEQDMMNKIELNERFGPLHMVRDAYNSPIIQN